LVRTSVVLVSVLHVNIDSQGVKTQTSFIHKLITRVIARHSFVYSQWPDALLDNVDGSNIRPDDNTRFLSALCRGAVSRPS